MFNSEAIDKTPTVYQIKAIIKYMVNDSENNYDFSNMMDMSRVEPNKIILDLNNAHIGVTYEVVFDEGDTIVVFKKTGVWMS